MHVLNSLNAGPVFVTKDRVECAWQHEIPECCCIAVDADVPVLGTFVRISLFRIEVENVKRNSSKGLGSSETNNYTYLIDYNRTGDIEPIVMPLVLEPGIALICLKLIGEDIVLLGGAKGYLGVCDYGDSSVTSRQFEGHSVDVSVTCIATCHARNLAICGDDGGGLSLWMLTASVDRLQCITVVGGESTGRSAVNSIQFVPDRNLIVVSTRLQLLLLGLQVSPDTGRHELEGIRVLDVNSLFVSVCSTVSPIKSLPSFGDDPDSEIFHCHCIAFPNHSAGSSAIRYDFGGLKSNTMSPARSSNEGGEHCSWPLVIWKISGVSALGGKLHGDARIFDISMLNCHICLKGAPSGSASLWRIEGNYEWLDENASAMITLGKFAAERMVRRTLSGHLVQHAAEVIDYERNHKNYSVDVDFTVVHQV